MKYKWLYFAISFVILLPGIFSLAIHGLRLSIDFTGGSLIEVQLPKSNASADIKTIATNQGISVSSVQSSEDNTYLVRSKPTDQATVDKLVSSLGKDKDAATLLRFETVGPVIGGELTQKAILAVCVASLAIVLYIAWSFRAIPKPYSPWKFGLSAVIALLHDAFVVLGIFSLLGAYLHVEIDSLFVTALLTVIGFSVHDTIVVFDRVRENLPKMPQATFEQVVDFSLTETLGRSLNTSLTVVLTLTALMLFGGETVRWFVAALLIGIISGTYSSIFNASPLLVLWETPKHSKHK